MAEARKKYEDIDSYIKDFPPEVQARLEQMRQTIKAAAPAATEAISYQIPTFKLKKNLVHFAAFKGHIGFYPGTAPLEAFADALAPYHIGKGSVQFPFEAALPVGLITEMVLFRVRALESAPPKSR